MTNNKIFTINNNLDHFGKLICGVLISFINTIGPQQWAILKNAVPKPIQIICFELTVMQKTTIFAQNNISKLIKEYINTLIVAYIFSGFGILKQYDIYTPIYFKNFPEQDKVNIVKPEFNNYLTNVT